MKTDLFYFSGTGNGLFIAKMIKEQLELASYHEELVTIHPMSNFNLSVPITSDANRIGLIYPTYNMDAPCIVKRFASTLHPTHTPYLFIYTHSGGFPGNSIYSIKDILETRGFEVANVFHAVYPDNSVLRPIHQEKMLQQLSNAHALHIEDSLTIMQQIKNPIHPLLKRKQTISALSQLMNFYFQNVIGFKDITVNQKSCTQCSICANICPVNNISINNQDFPAFNTHCEMCMGCINACPNQALRYKKMKHFDNFQYRHPEISLHELMLD